MAMFDTYLRQLASTASTHDVRSEHIVKPHHDWRDTKAAQKYAHLIGSVSLAASQCTQPRQVVSKLLDLHPPLRVCYTGVDVTFPWTTEDTAVADDQLLRHVISDEIYNVPLFRWKQRGFVLYFWIHHYIADGESVRIIKRHLEQLLNSETLPVLPYGLLSSALAELQSMQMNRSDFMSQAFIAHTLSPTDNRRSGSWRLSGLQTSRVDMLACITLAVAQASFCVSGCEKALIMLFADARFMPEIEHNISSLVSYLIVRKIGLFHHRASIPDTRRVIDSLTTLRPDLEAGESERVAIPSLNFNVHEEMNLTDSGLGLVQYPTTSDAMNEINIHYAPKLGMLTFMFAGISASPSWFHSFESHLSSLIGYQPAPLTCREQLFSLTRKCRFPS